MTTPATTEIKKFQQSPTVNWLLRPAKFFAASLRERPELAVFLLLMLVLSGPVFFGAMWRTMMFDPAAVLAGEWWRLFTHPFVHVSWYHLLLDGTAFLLLYHGLSEPSRTHRMICVAAAGTGSLLLTWIAAPIVFTTGLCGLSGIAHGLMAVSAVEMMWNRQRDSVEWRIGAITFAIVTGKAAFEALTGGAFFEFLYFGLVGIPVTVSHAGGVIGGLVGWLLCRKKYLQRCNDDSLQAVSFRHASAR